MCLSPAIAHKCFRRASDAKILWQRAHIVHSETFLVKECKSIKTQKFCIKPSDTRRHKPEHAAAALWLCKENYAIFLYKKKVLLEKKNVRENEKCEISLSKILSRLAVKPKPGSRLGFLSFQLGLSQLPVWA